MLWLVPALVASLVGVWITWTRGLQAPAAILLVVSFALVFVLGRRIEAGQDTEWQDAAAQVGGTFRSAPPLHALDRFGLLAPWNQWARDGELQCTRAVDGIAATPPFALLQIRYSVRERRGEEQPDSWYEVTVAAVRLPHGDPADRLQPVPAPAGWIAMQNGQSLFLWKKGSPGAGATIPGSELPALLQQARQLAGAVPQGR
jgi:hypothetical protein